MIPPLPKSTLFPYTTLFRSSQNEIEAITDPKMDFPSAIDARGRLRVAAGATSIPYALLLDSKGIVRYQGHPAALSERKLQRDRKSTRLNSSHTVISYAVFCL